MAYTFEDEKGFLGHGPSINGLRELKKFFYSNAQLKDYPAMEMLLKHGATHLTAKLAAESRALAETCKDKDVKSSLTSLASDAAKATGAIVLAL